MYRKRQAILSLLGVLLVALGTAAVITTSHESQGTGAPATGATSTPTSISHTYPTGPRDHPGVWEAVPYVPLEPVHSALLPDGQVIMWGEDRNTFLFDYRTRSFSGVIESNTNLFCGGLALLPDGRLLVAGGTKEYNMTTGEWMGLDSAEIFDPATKKWTQIPNMTGGPRWYPTQITLADGRVAVFTGTENGIINPNVEIYDPVSNTWSPAGELTLPMYARGHVMPDGKVVLFSTPDQATYVWDPATGTASRGPIQLLGYRLALDQKPSATGGSVMVDAVRGRLVLFGGPHGGVQAHSAEAFDYATRSWSWGTRLNHDRQWVTGVGLPNGDVLAVGGDTGLLDLPPIPAEWLDLATGSWIDVAAPHNRLPYHSTALLLPDGSVLATNQKDRVTEIYKPWYFFAGERPVITHAPSRIAYGQGFAIATPDAEDVQQVVLVRVSSTTHGLNTDQRRVVLDFVEAAGEITAVGPTTSSIAPPGYYLLFLLDDRGVPSEG
ncbi:MAG TPA: galactose oxidase-like domain-containing protein, partial [Candidatus Thermoplasmatota archaeon]|nr:galactose oxidase-like domain-containing protein [Candidatus Thermoplasmatota archaeon]